MATTTMFKPSTDDFGQLTMHATILGEQAFSGASKETHRDSINVLIVLAFLITLVVAVVGLYRMDQALFAHPHQQVASAHNVAVDYD